MSGSSIGENILLAAIVAYIVAMILFATSGCTTTENDNFDWNPFEQAPHEIR